LVADSPGLRLYLIEQALAMRLHELKRDPIDQDCDGIEIGGISVCPCPQSFQRHRTAASERVGGERRTLDSVERVVGDFNQIPRRFYVSRKCRKLPRSEV
jgi:GTP cyclohydrolase FolE2